MIDNGRIFVIDDKFFNQIQGGRFDAIAGFNGDMIMIRKTYFENADNLQLLQTLAHEAIHIRGGFDFSFKYGEFESELDKALRLTYEMMTDYWGDISIGVTPFSMPNTQAYAINEPGYALSIYQRMLKSKPELLDDLKEFALTGEAKKLLYRVTGLAGDSPEAHAAFLKWFEEDLGIKIDKFVVEHRDITKAVIIIVTEAAAAHQVSTYIPPNFSLSGALSDIGSSIQQVIIENVGGTTAPGQQIDISSIVTEDGYVSDNPDDFTITYTLENTEPQSFLIQTALAQETKSIKDISALPGGEKCSEYCKITIPEDLEPGQYELVAYLHRKDSDKVLDKDSQVVLITVPEPPGQEVQQKEIEEAPLVVEEGVPDSAEVVEEEGFVDNIIVNIGEVFRDTYSGVEDVLPILPDPEPESIGEYVTPENDIPVAPDAVLSIEVEGPYGRFDITDLDSLELFGFDQSGFATVFVTYSSGRRRLLTYYFEKPQVTELPPEEQFQEPVVEEMPREEEPVLNQQVCPQNCNFIDGACWEGPIHWDEFDQCPEGFDSYADGCWRLC